MTEPANDVYRRAAFGLAHAAQQPRFGSVIFSSATAGEGTTSAVVQTGRFLMRDCGLKPLVLELNSRRAAFSRLFDLDDRRSLAAIVAGERTPADCVQPDPSGLPLLPAGRLDDAPFGSGSGLESVLCRIVQELQNDYEMILVDAPPILESADVFIAGRVVPRLVLVVGAGRVSRNSLLRARQELESANIRVIGTILNTRRRIIPGWMESWFRR